MSQTGWMIGRARSDDSQVVRGAPRFDSLGGGSFRDLASGGDGPSKPFASGGIHHAARHPWGDERNSAPENHWKWRIYAIATSGTLFAIALGATLMEVFKK